MSIRRRDIGAGVECPAVKQGPERAICEKGRGMLARALGQRLERKGTSV